MKLDHEGNYDGKDDAANKLVIDEDDVFDKKAPGLIDDGGDDAFLDFVNFDDSDYEYEYENEEELAIQLPKTRAKGWLRFSKRVAKKITPRQIRLANFFLHII